LVAARAGSSAQTLGTVLALLLARRSTGGIGANQFLTAAGTAQNLSHHSPTAFVACHVVTTFGAGRMRVTEDFQSGVLFTVVTFECFLVLALFEESANLLTEIGVGLREHFGTWLHRGEKFKIQIG